MYQRTTTKMYMMGGSAHFLLGQYQVPEEFLHKQKVLLCVFSVVKGAHGFLENTHIAAVRPILLPG